MAVVAGSVAFAGAPALASSGPASGSAPAAQHIRWALGARAVRGGAVTLVLPPAHPGGLAALARATRLSRAQRLAALPALLPSAAQHTAVEAAASALGLSVTGQNTWTVDLAGSASQVLALFGSARGSRPSDPVAQSLPRMPAALRGLVTVALGGDETRPAVRALLAHRAASGLAAAVRAGLARNVSGGGYSGQDITGSYQTSVGAPAAAYGGQTVATLQISGWDSNDLTAYARAASNNSTVNPVTDGQYTPVSIDSADPTAPDANGDDAEVALDQESLYGIAPYARQRAYFTQNSLQGEVDALQRMGNDAQIPSLHLVAASDSYGDCEADYPSGDIQALNTVIEQLVAEGVTFFSASGDSGSADCPASSTDNVDFPASSPYAVAVGGTTLTLGSPPTETAWSGSGGGTSQFFSRPAYQSSIGITGTMRLLPDIAADADPNTGYSIYCSLSDCVNGTSPWSVVGGTSFAAPSDAAMLTDELIASGVNNGIGDIHQVLYSAPAAALRDVTSGSNGSFSAGPGYDEVTGLGTVQWDALRQNLISEASTYHPVSPTRVLDTRTGLGAPKAPLGARASVTLHLAGASGTNVPANATGVVLNVTAVDVTGPTYVSVYPTGDLSGPQSSNLNPVNGSTEPNLVATRLGNGGSITLYNNNFSTDLVGDVEGYLTADTTGSEYHTVSPTRVLDTRKGLGAPQQPLGPQGTVRLAVAGAAGDPVPQGANAVVLNVTGTNATATTYLSVYPTGDAQGPSSSNLNLNAGQTAANLVTVPLASDGSVTLYNNRGSTDVIADAEGYYTAASAGAAAVFHPLEPHRVLDTRKGVGAPAQPVGPHAAISVTVAVSALGVPSGISAIVLNLTGTDPTASTYLSAYPSNDPSGPSSSNLNLLPGQTVPNLAIVPVNSDGTVTIYNNLGSTDVVADIEGYYAAS